MGYILFVVGALRMRAGTALAQPGDLWAALTGVLLILELARRLTGLALVVIVGVFIAYSVLGPWLPGFLNHRGYSATRFFAASATASRPALTASRRCGPKPSLQRPVSFQSEWSRPNSITCPSAAASSVSASLIVTDV